MGLRGPLPARRKLTSVIAWRVHVLVLLVGNRVILTIYGMKDLRDRVTYLRLCLCSRAAIVQHHISIDSSNAHQAELLILQQN